MKKYKLPKARPCDIAFVNRWATEFADSDMEFLDFLQAAAKWPALKIVSVLLASGWTPTRYKIASDQLCDFYGIKIKK